MFLVFKRPNALPMLLCALVLALMLGSLSMQALEVRASLPQAPQAALGQALANEPAPLNMPNELFGSTQPVAAALPANLRLLASFVQSDAQHSLALIAYEGQAPKRVAVAEEIAPGLVLERVDDRRVSLLWQGRSFELSLHAPHAGNLASLASSGGQP